MTLSSRIVIALTLAFASCSTQPPAPKAPEISISEIKDNEPKGIPKYEEDGRMAPHQTKMMRAPQYPPEMRRKELDGEVVLIIAIDETGKPIQVGWKSATNEQFLRSALAVAPTATWKPVLIHGKPSKVWFYMPVIFQIKNVNF